MQRAENIAPFLSAQQTAKFLRQSVQTTVIGTNNYYAEINSYKPISGRFLSQEDAVSESSSVVVLGYTIAEKLFSGAEPIGQAIKVGNMGFRVIA